MNDRNKSELTIAITKNVALWLDGKGFKPVETEVPVADGWIADVAGVCCPTQTEMLELKIIPRPPRYRGTNWHEEGSEYNKDYAVWRVKHDAIPHPLTALVEVKTSRGDYMGDRKWMAEWPTNLCYVAMPEGMIDPMHWPHGWGVILFSQNGAVVRKVHAPSAIRPLDHEKQLWTIHSLAVARDHQTRYARLRELARKQRITDGEYTSIGRISHAIRFVGKVMAGMEIEAALEATYVKVKLPDHIRQELEALRQKSTPNIV